MRLVAPLMQLASKAQHHSQSGDAVCATVKPAVPPPSAFATVQPTARKPVGPSVSVKPAVPPPVAEDQRQQGPAAEVDSQVEAATSPSSEPGDEPSESKTSCDLAATAVTLAPDHTADTTAAPDADGQPEAALKDPVQTGETTSLMSSKGERATLI